MHASLMYRQVNFSDISTLFGPCSDSTLCEMMALHSQESYKCLSVKENETEAQTYNTGENYFNSPAGWKPPDRTHTLVTGRYVADL